MAMSEEILERIARIEEEKLKWTKEQFKWTKLLGMGQLKSIFEQNLRDDSEKLVYELSDGERSIRDIEKITNVSRTKIATLWKKWFNMGIMEKSTKYEGKRMKRSFSLSDVGIDIPQMSTSTNNTQVTPEAEFE